MSSEVRIRDTDFMESQTENESLRVRVREIEDENQELRAQNLILNRTVIELRNELFLIRIQMNELTDTSSLLRERVRNLIQQQQQQQQEQQQLLLQQESQDNDRSAGPLTAPPLMPPPNPPPPPPLPPARIRISPRQVGAGEALMTPLGVSLSSPPRHRVKRECRQGFYRPVRNPYRRLDIPEPGPSTANSFVSTDRTNYFVGLRIVPQFQTSFVCSQSGSSEYSDSASDSSGSDENPQVITKSKPRTEDSLLRKPPSLKDNDIFKNVRNLHHGRVRSPVLQNYNLSLPNTNSKFIFPVAWNGNNKENSTLPSTSGSQNRFTSPERFGTNGTIHNENVTLKNISNCVQYTFPAIHEGLHNNGISSLVSGTSSRPRKFKRNIVYLPPDGANYSNVGGSTNPREKLHAEKSQNSMKVDSESMSSTDEGRFRRSSVVEELPSDFEQDGFQADESSNCMTSADNSLDKISMNDANMEKKT